MSYDPPMEKTEEKKPEGPPPRTRAQHRDRAIEIARAAQAMQIEKRAKEIAAQPLEEPTTKQAALRNAVRKWGERALVTRSHTPHRDRRYGVGMKEEDGTEIIYGRGASWAEAFEAADANIKELEAEYQKHLDEQRAATAQEKPVDAE